MGELAPDTMVHGRYRIKRIISNGGMSSVYEAFDEDLERIVAIKQNGDVLPGVLFLREAKLLAKLRHSHLPAAIDVFEENDGQFFVMDYIEGQDLDQLLTEHKKFSGDEIDSWVRQILDALEYLHTRDQPIIHRDIKPANLILSNGTMFLVDFGISKDSMRTWLAGSGTRQYASPEHASGPTTAESDLYSLAATIYHLLTGRPVPAADIRLQEVRIKGRSDPLVPAHLADPSVTQDISEVLSKGLNLDPEERYHSAAEMRQAWISAIRAVELPGAAAVPPPTATTRIKWGDTQARLEQIGRGQPAWLRIGLPALLAALLLLACIWLVFFRDPRVTTVAGGSGASAAGEASSAAPQSTIEASAAALNATAETATQIIAEASGDAGRIVIEDPPTPTQAPSTPTAEVAPTEEAAPSEEVAPTEAPATPTEAAPTPTEAAASAAPSAPAEPTPAPEIVPPTLLPPAAPNTIRIALQSPQSGEWAAIGQSILHGAELSILQQNRPLTDLGYRVEFYPFDDRSNSDQGRANAEAIVADPSVLCVVGHFNSGVTLAAQEVYGTASLVQISPGSTNPQVTDGNETVWRVVGRDDVQGAVAARYAREVLKSQRPYIINDDTTYGRGIANFFRRDFEANNLGIAGFVAFDDTQATIDYAPFLDEIQSTNADVIYFAGSYTRAGPFFKQARERGIGAQFLGSDSLDNPELAQLAGDAVNGMRFTTVAAPVSEFEQAAKFAQDYQAAFGQPAPPFSPESYDATTICMQAVARAARERGRIPTRAEVMDTMRRLPAFRGISGNYDFNDNGDPEKVAYFIVEVNAQNWSANRVVQQLQQQAP